MNDNKLSDKEKKLIEEYEKNNSFICSILQKECLCYEHYCQEILDDIEYTKNT